MRRRLACALCGGDVTDRTVLKLPDTPCANEFVAVPQQQDLFPLDLQLCGSPGCGHLQLGVVIEPERLFGDYVYLTGTSPVFIEHFAAYARQAVEVARLDRGSTVVDIGSNDGTLLTKFAELGITGIHGVEPARRIAAAANADGIPTTNAFFGRGVALGLRQRLGPADLVTANNVFAHVEDLGNTALAVRELLAPDGIFIFEVSYLLDVVEKMLFDTIYHEHLSYHAVRPLRGFFDRLGMTLFDVERVPAHGGSLRCYVSRRPRPVAARVAELVRLEEAAALFNPSAYVALGERIAVQGARLRNQLAQLRLGGARLCGYGAPAKLTTLMYTFGLHAAGFDFVVDDSPVKQGLFTPGAHMPVVDSAAMARVSGQGYWCVVFAWNFFDSIVSGNSGWIGDWLNPLDGAHRQHSRGDRRGEVRSG